MAKKAVTDAVAARLATNWSETPILALNAATQTPADGGPWVRLEFPVANGTQTTLGRSYRETGAFRIAVATQILSGLDRSMLYCEQIAAVFRNQKFDGVECKTPTIREGVDDGSYFMASVVIPYVFRYSD